MESMKLTMEQQKKMLEDSHWHTQVHLKTMAYALSDKGGRVAGCESKLSYMERRIEDAALDGAEAARHLVQGIQEINWIQVVFEVAWSHLQRSLVEVLQQLQKAMKMRGEVLLQPHWSLCVESAYRQVE